MADHDLLGPADTGSSGDDAVTAARAWLAQRGAAVPATEPLLVRSARPSRPQPEVEGGPQQAAGPESRGREAVGRSGSRRGSGRSSAPHASTDPGADPDADPESVARTIVLRKLAAQARTRHELAKALADRHVPDEVAEAVLDRFESVGLVDDATFARDWVDSRQQRRHLSKSALRRELQTKGVDRDLIDAVVSEVGGSDELAAAQALAEKKMRSVAGLPREVQYRRLAGALARRGFSGGVTAAVVGSLLDAGPDQ